MSSLSTAWRNRPTHHKVWALAAPMILSNISVPLVALVDSTVIGHLPHAHQLGAVAVGATLFTFMVGLLGFLRMGSTGFAAQAAGRADGAALRQVLVQGLLLALAFAVLIGLLALPFSQLALHAMQPSEALHASTEAFFHTRLLGLPAALASYALVGWFLGTQNARAPLAILLTTNLLNIALNLWFVLGLDWGVVGSARASVIAEWSAALLGLALTRPALRAYPGQVAWAALKRWQSWRPLLAVNRDIFLRSLALQLVFLLLTVQGARLGEATVAANALLLNGLMLTAYALDGLAHAVEALCGHAIGARDRSALKQALVVACGWSLIVSLVFAVLFLLGGHLFIDLQTDIANVRDAAYPYLPYLAVLPLVAVWSYLLDGLFIGATRAREMRNAMLLSVAVALPLALAMRGFGNHGLWWAFLGFMVLRAVTLGWLGWRLQQRDRWIR
ncbi:MULTISPECIES: MATE family efflux transporter [unclassified Pseudomonas]|uniref:MATE family efflux transporter n=1 Tax=unclassified Pseudomonas TaxID=196821 RepID=UPI000C88EB70|nr:MULTISPECIES: MATE family efflux transporter [unclassified Pseudomonas]PMZ92473.1 MATE family efflux transporter [Pseudomonas sp. FW305-42]PNA20720.1 MATE family efflux transporter [Pseudomonas sp. MPR-R1B]PNB22077.1 MATE family efflux transporter [Pseudomonas sp. DP16D-E2]PNB41300.1 MATE family efflux transporter [Pseudomonas sp. FW305-17]PNB56882.1 MATE family efflux transporter [Pseudomonas sp. GW531-E2]